MGVQNSDIGATGGLDSCIAGTRSCSLRIVHNPEAGIRCAQPVKDFTGPIVRHAVYNNNLKPTRRDFLSQNRANTRLYDLLLVTARNYDRNGGEPIVQCVVLLAG